MIRLEEDGGLFYENGVFLGDVLMKEDGFYDFWPDLKGGCWDSGILHAIANLLDQINETWEKEIDEAFSNRC